MKSLVTVNVTAARRGDPAIGVTSTNDQSTVDAWALAKDLMAAADWAEELALAGQEEAEGRPA